MKNYKEKFDEYYLSYLGLCQNDKLKCVNKEEFEVNGFKYPLIVSYYKGNTLYSLDSQYNESIIVNLKNCENLQEIKKYLKNYFRKHK